MESVTFEQLPSLIAEIKLQLQRIEDRVMELTRPPDEKKLISITEASKLINLAESTIYGKVCRREIPVTKKGKKLYFEKSALLNWLREGKKKTVEELFDEADTFNKNMTPKRRRT